MRIVSGKDLRIATLSGAVVLLKAGEPRTVSHTIGAIALQMGARQVEDIEGVVEKAPLEIQITETITDVDTLVVEPEETTDVVDLELIAALERLIEMGNPQDFKSDGSPKAAIVNRAVGRTVRSDEREQAWEIALNS
jgi:hypothetical protein